MEELVTGRLCWGRCVFSDLVRQCHGGAGEGLLLLCADESWQAGGALERYQNMHVPGAPAGAEVLTWTLASEI